ncbi:MAG: hypothetical protein JXR79_02895 [Nitrospirae bacterium]|nr:hypothetical protein [Nitrospirota bacterium]
MARVFSETGRYVTHQSIKKYEKQFVIIFLFSIFLNLILGYALGKNTHPYSLMLLVTVILVCIFSKKKLDRLIESLERERG